MRRPEAPLARLQRWMQAVVLHTGPLEEALASPAAVREIAADEVGSVLSSPLERLGVYHTMYALRIEQALAVDFAVLREHLGEEKFARLVRDYLSEHPPRSFTLSRAGDDLPGFLSRWRGAGARRRAWLAELARLELALAEIEDAPDSPELKADAIQAVPPDAWGRAHLVPVRALRLMTFRYPVHRLYERYLDDLPPRPPRLEPSWLVLYRRGGRSRPLSLERDAFDLFAALAQGKRLGEALAGARGRRGGARRVFEWLRQWVAEGLFQEVVV